jgi:hypothetical protein
MIASGLRVLQTLLVVQPLPLPPTRTAASTEIRSSRAGFSYLNFKSVWITEIRRTISEHDEMSLTCHNVEHRYRGSRDGFVAQSKDKEAHDCSKNGRGIRGSKVEFTFCSISREGI